MEVGQGPNLGCSAKGQKNYIATEGPKYKVTVNVNANLSVPYNSFTLPI
jgi:hypothetical protein